MMPVLGLFGLVHDCHKNKLRCTAEGVLWTPLNTVYRLNTVSLQKTDRPAFVMGISNPLESDHWAPYENEMKNGHAINHEVKAGRREKEREGPDIASKANRWLLQRWALFHWADLLAAAVCMLVLCPLSSSVCSTLALCVGARATATHLHWLVSSFVH